jgi:hypothetical protein
MTSTTKRVVTSGEHLTGHGTSGNEPEIHIMSGDGPGNGSLICVLGCFHRCDVTKSTSARGTLTILDFGKTKVAITDGVVEYYGNEPLV